MEIAGQWVKLAPLVHYDDYDNCGYLLDIKQNALIELNEHDTLLLSAILRSSTLTEVYQYLARAQPSSVDKDTEADVLTLVERLQDQKLVELEKARSFSASSRDSAPPQNPQKGQLAPCHPITWRQRLVSAGHSIIILAGLCKGDEGVYKAHQYLWKLKEHNATKTISATLAVALVGKEYWFYRLITGLLERRVAHVIGQVPGNEGLCLIRALSLCAYLLPLGVPASVVIARPKYGSRDGFKLHVWVEVEDGTTLNERPNIADGYRRLYAFPFSYRT